MTDTTLRSMWEIAADLCDPAGAGGTVWVPYPKQRLATELAHRADEVLFGGAAGPGKTEWLMEHGIEQMERFPGNRGAIFRRVFPSLNRTIIPRLKVKLAGGRATWNSNDHTFTFPNKSILECASLQYADSVLEHQGVEYGWIGFEEITEFLESQWEYMIGRLRAPNEGIRPHACATTNPGGRGHRWVKRRWVKPNPEIDLEDPDEKPTPFVPWRPKYDPVRHGKGKPLIRVFVPATHEDNPALLERDPGYLDRLRTISNRGLRLAMEKGDWDAIDAVEGALWSQDDLDRGRVSTDFRKRMVQTMRRVIAVDPSDGDDDGDDYGVAVCSKGMDGVGYVEGSYAWSASPRKMAEKTVDLYHELRADAIVIERNHGGKWMREVFRQVDPTARIVTVWASEGKHVRAEPVAALFEHDPEDTMPYRVRMVGWHPDLEEELTSWVDEPGNPSPNRLDAMVWGLTDLMIGLRTVRKRQGNDQRLTGRR